MYLDADYGTNPPDPVWTEIARLDGRISWVNANVGRPLYDEIEGLHQNMEALNYPELWSRWGGEPKGFKIF